MIYTQNKAVIRNASLSLMIMFIFFATALSAAEKPATMLPDYPLELMNIKPVGTDGMTSANRIYRAYPGIPYNIRAAVIGGRYPYTFTLTAAPKGMSIDSNSGEINWPQPEKNADATITVTDTLGNSISETWKISVGTEKFLFVDSVRGQHAQDGGTGSMSAPFKTIADFYPDEEQAGLRSKKHADYFIYFREGTYKLDGFKTGWGGVEDKMWINFRKQHPNILMGYPGETATFDLESAYSIQVNGRPDFYIDSIHFRGLKDHKYALQLMPERGDLTHLTIRRLDMRGLGPTTGNNNQSFIRLMSGGRHMSKHMVIQDCVFDDLNHGSGIKLYTVDKVLIEDNAFSHFKDSAADLDGAVALKVCVRRCVLRHNTISDFEGGRMVSCLMSTVYRKKPYRGTSENVISHNLIYNSRGGSSVELYAGKNPGVMHIYNNTIACPIVIRSLKSEAGPFWFFNNIFVNDQSADQITFKGESDKTRIKMGDNLSINRSKLDKHFSLRTKELRERYGHVMLSRKHSEAASNSSK